MDLENLNLGELSDEELTGRMRECNFTKFKALVRMHLSFELDLNTDEFDLPCHEIVYEDKGKFKKWNRMSKKHKHGSSSGTTGCSVSTKNSTSAGNSPTEGLNQQIDAGFLFHLKELKEFMLLEKNLTQEGIFRKTGSVSRQNELRLHIQNAKPLDLAGGGYSAHDCATVFKGYLADLSEPLLTDAHYPAHLQLAALCCTTPLSSSTTSKPPNPERLKREQHLLSSVQLLLLLLPAENRQLLQHIIEILHAVACHESANKMSPENLATLFAPHLICPRNLPPEALHYVAKKMYSVIAYMVTKGSQIFQMPAKLSTDIRAYFLERKRKKTMSPEQTLDDSISDVSTVNTVYTFVDREKTAAAHTANNTDTELAQLYAHIQSLPESSKKRRLIKQFNKQNGQGTPLQFVVMNRLKNSESLRGAKSIGDSIKKHIFHKGIMSRTPKRQATTLSVGVETPTISHSKNPKLRVLFQSPALTSVSASSSSSSSSNCTSTNTPCSIKRHPLQKSISSSSLLLSSSMALHNPAPNTGVGTLSSSSSDGILEHRPAIKFSCSVSAPVSRQTSTDLNARPSYSPSTINPASLSINSSTSSSTGSATHRSCCETPLKMISEAAKHFINVGGDKKTVAWGDTNLLDIEETPNPSTPLQHINTDLKSRYKSEPNLSRIPKSKLGDEQSQAFEVTPVLKQNTSLASKLIKGVSMGNLKSSFATPELSKPLGRSISSTITGRSLAARLHTGVAAVPHHVDPVDLDDDTFEDNPDDHVESESDPEADLDEQSVATAGGSSSNELPGSGGNAYQQMLLQQSGHYRNLDLLTSTPSLLLGRRSMSPITKSTQRMPKAMQESIMTPRSRKPVMVLTTTLGSSDQNQTIYQTDLSSFREQDEEDSPSVKPAQQGQPPMVHNEDAISLGGYTDILRRQKLSQTNLSFVHQTNVALTRLEPSDASNADALTNNFKEYLLSRSVLTASPVDSSFSSQPDDFASTQDMEDLDVSHLSPSLLYCLDGNEPDIPTTLDDPHSSRDDINIEALENGSLNVKENSDSATEPASNPFSYFNNARKRAATCDRKNTPPPHNGSPSTSKGKAANKENCNNAEGYHRLSKKLLISKFPGETSF